MVGGKGVISDDEDDVGIEEEERDEEPNGDDVRNMDDDEEEEEEEGQDEYEKDGFIVDDVEEEEEEEEERVDSDERQKKKRKKKRELEKNYLLDEDDYELLQESNISVPRPKLESKKFKRLKKARGSGEGETSGFSDEEEFDGSGKGRHTAEEKLKRTLFGDDDGQPLEDIAEEDEPSEMEDEDIGEEDEMADFIVDEEEIDEHGAPVRRKKPKKSRQHPGVSSSSIQEALEIFGDVDDLLRLRKLETRDGYGETGAKSLEDHFDPSVLSEKYMTGKDEEIRAEDIPERIQISVKSTGDPPTDETSNQMETDWIYDQLLNGPVPVLGKGTSSKEVHNELKRDISRFLELIHAKFDVPFIAMYRKEKIMSLLNDPNDLMDSDPNRNPTVKWHKLLWTIKDLDEKWLLLEKRKSALLEYCTRRFEEESRRVYDETRLNLNRQIYDSIMAALKSASSEREVDDVDLKFNLHFPPGDVVLDDKKYKRPNRKSPYSICNKAGLWEVASKFCYSAEIFGKLASLEKVRTEELEDPKETPEEMASVFTSMMFQTPEDVLKGTRHMAAVEISCEPRVRKHVRGIFMDEAVVTTTPTSSGNTAIDSFHQFAGVKWLLNKPLNSFEDAQWLIIQKAEEEKLLQVTISLPVPVLEKLLSDAKEYYLSDGVSKSAQLWNEQRKQIIEDAFYNFLFPSMEKEARSLLTTKAKAWLLWEYGRLLWNKVSVAPYPPKGNDANDEEAAPRVMACCWGPGKPATTFAMLDSSGEVLDVLHAGSLNLRGQSVNEQQSKKHDQQRVQKFMMDQQPHIVVLGAANLSCTRLKDDIYEIIFKMVEDNPRDVGHEMDNLNVIYGDESLPHLYENSRISVDQLPSQEGIVRRAVALGRYLQNPLAMAATLCGPGREILSWKLHPLENFISPDEKYGMVEQVMVDITNQVGIDLNLASSHEWLFASLQFISGLGPRKASSLQRSLVRAGPVYKRSDLMFSHGLGKVIFINAAGFLRLRPSGLASISTQFIDLLDDTRIHPQSYPDAIEFARDILKENGDYNNDDLAMAVDYVREKPHLLKAVDIQEYAEQKDKLHIKETLDDIRLELIEGFQERRRPFEEPNPDEEFFMISGETQEALSEGRMVQVTVRRVQPQRAMCVLESGLTGVLNKEDYSDDWRDSNDLTDKLHEGDILTCRVKSIFKNRYQVFLTCRESETRSNHYENHQRVEDPYYHENHSTLNIEQDKSRKEKELAKRLFKPRMIVHPRFQNINADEAVEFLSDKDPGESVVRPSSRGPLFLTITLKIYDGVYAHKDISEGGKEHKDITSLLRIGKKLKIGDDTFEDLDEVMDRYVDPLVAHLKAMLSYRKFRRGTKVEVDELLRMEKAENPSRIAYGFGVAHEHPGTFILTYVRSSNPHHEYIGLYPKGFKFRKRMFEDIDRLVAYFQRHIDAPHDSAPSIRSVAAMVPMRSPATSGFGGGSSNEDGWRGRGQTGRNDESRPFRGRGGGRGRGRDSYGGGKGDRQESRYGSQGSQSHSSWGSKDGDSGGGWSSGGKAEQSGGDWGNWGGGADNGGAKDAGNSGWGSGGGGGW